MPGIATKKYIEPLTPFTALPLRALHYPYSHRTLLQDMDTQSSIEEPQHVEVKEVVQELIPFEGMIISLSMYAYEDTPSNKAFEDMEKQSQEIPKEAKVEASIQEFEVLHVEEVVLMPRILFERKKLDLSIYTFDELWVLVSICYRSSTDEAL